MKSFFQDSYTELVDSPNGTKLWWHSLPLPDGRRINGKQPDKDVQFKKWAAMQIGNPDGLAGKSVLDIGANDGFFSIAAAMSGASDVTAIDMDWGTWPANIKYASEVWQVEPNIITDDFRTHAFPKTYDVILFLGVLYHLENVFACMELLNRLLTPRGTIYLETQISRIQADVPIFEYASDSYPTIARQGKQNLRRVGISNYLFPNEHAVHNLAQSYDFVCESLDGPQNLYTRQNPTRGFYRLTKEERKD